MKRLFTLILTAALISISFSSCTERTSIEFNQPSKSCGSDAQVIVLDTTMPIEYIGVRTDNGTNYIDCQNIGNTLECNGDWFTVSSGKNANQVIITINANTTSSNREIKVQALSNGAAATCTLTQSGNNQ